MIGRKFFIAYYSLLYAFNKKPTKSIARNQRGQTLLEFILLFLIVTGISLVFLKGINTKISQYWVQFVKVIVGDSSQNYELN